MMSNEINVKIGENEVKVQLKRSELLYGIEGLYYNGFSENVPEKILYDSIVF